MGFLSNHIEVRNTLIFPGTVNKVSDLKAPMCLLLTTVRCCHIDDVLNKTKKWKLRINFKAKTVNSFMKISN